jgi:hypothetical protein
MNSFKQQTKLSLELQRTNLYHFLLLLLASCTSVPVTNRSGKQDPETVFQNRRSYIRPYHHLPDGTLEILKEALKEKIMNFLGLNSLKKEWQLKLRFLKIMLFQKIKFFQVWQL